VNLVAKALIDSKAVYIEPQESNYFTWTSGKRSPIYCDNRQLISYPELRSEIVSQFCLLIKNDYSSVELIAGTATAGIPWAAWIAHELNLPMVYIRSKPKGHGLKSAIEGKLIPGQKTLIIEDLISTGKSSIEALSHARVEKLEVLSILSIFSYGLSESLDNLSNSEVKHQSLCTLSELLEYANDSGLIQEKDVGIIEECFSRF